MRSLAAFGVLAVAAMTISGCGRGDSTTAPANSTAGTEAATSNPNPNPTEVAPSLPAVPFGYSDLSVPLPPWFTGPGPGGSAVAADNTPASNPTTDAGATLGRVLFYDTRLSSTGTIACGSCHLQSLGFGDTTRFSKGVAGVTARHTMSLANARFYARGHFFWDERANALEDQVLQPIQNPVEMGETLPDVVAKVSASNFYPALFKAAFGTTEVTSARISLALAQFVRSLVSSHSRYDAAFANSTQPNFALLTQEEQQGQQLFVQSGCGACHATNAVIADNIHNNGLDAATTDVGAGNGQFKAPSLRNVGLRSLRS